MMHGGAIVDVSLIVVFRSTKNCEGKRNPEIHQTKKSSEWYFGLNVHVGDDASKISTGVRKWNMKNLLIAAGLDEPKIFWSAWHNVLKN